MTVFFHLINNKLSRKYSTLTQNILNKELAVTLQANNSTLSQSSYYVEKTGGQRNIALIVRSLGSYV